MKSLVFFLLLPQIVLSFEFISGTTFAIGAAVSYLYGDTVKDVSNAVSNVALCKTYLGYLNLYECCGSPWVKNNIDGLYSPLNSDS